MGKRKQTPIVRKATISAHTELIFSVTKHNLGARKVRNEAIELTQKTDYPAAEAKTCAEKNLKNQKIIEFGNVKRGLKANESSQMVSC